MLDGNINSVSSFKSVYTLVFNHRNCSNGRKYRILKHLFIFSVDHQPNLGRYDLRIKNSTYDRDNGNFECRKVEFGSGNKLHSSVIQLVVLLPPSPPRVEPLQPTVTEGKPFNLTCSSVGGSPPPEIFWYKNGEKTNLESLYLPAATRTEPTQSVLTIVPRKEDDNSSYRCTVWNRAIPETRIMEASTTIDVNCKYFYVLPVSVVRGREGGRDNWWKYRIMFGSRQFVSVSGVTQRHCFILSSNSGNQEEQ